MKVLATQMSSRDARILDFVVVQVSRDEFVRMTGQKETAATPYAGQEVTLITDGVLNSNAKKAATELREAIGYIKAGQRTIQWLADKMEEYAEYKNARPVPADDPPEA